jgi:hypothetical protein
METSMNANAPQQNMTPPYQATDAERQAIREHLARKERKAPAPRVDLKRGNGGYRLLADHPEPLLGLSLVMQAIGTVDHEFFHGLLNQLVNVTGGKTPDNRTLNFMLSVIKAIQPKDEAECMLAAQMAAVHMATMTFARRLNHVENIPQQDSAERAFNKLARTFAVQMEALKRNRTGGEQRVTVQHVTVNEGGRAIVGAVAATPGGVGDDKKASGQPRASAA